jgi:hypothetical protein
LSGIYVDDNGQTKLYSNNEWTNMSVGVVNEINDNVSEPEKVVPSVHAVSTYLKPNEIIRFTHWFYFCIYFN